MPLARKYAAGRPTRAAGTPDGAPMRIVITKAITPRKSDQTGTNIK
jgi:hypothetical protein